MKRAGNPSSFFAVFKLLYDLSLSGNRALEHYPFFVRKGILLNETMK